MSLSKDQIIVWSDRLRLVRLFTGSGRRRLTTILYHQFRFGEESAATARDRLRRQCEFLARNYTALTLDDAVGFVTSGAPGPDFPLLVTIDDAKRQILDDLDIFEEFSIPLALFVCAGWSDLADQGGRADRDPEGLLCRLLARLHFYDGEETAVRLDGQAFRLDRAGNAALIDAVIAADAGGTLADAEDLLALDRAAPDYSQICTWSELAGLKAKGVAIGAHSASHPQIARQTAARQRAECIGAKRLIEARLGPCRHFAYPYGIPGSYDDGTGELLREAGFETGFTTLSAFSAPGAKKLELPRIPLPDRPMSQAAFAARVRGGGAFLSQLKRGFR